MQNEINPGISVLKVDRDFGSVSALVELEDQKRAQVFITLNGYGGGVVVAKQINDKGWSTQADQDLPHEAITHVLHEVGFDTLQEVKHRTELGQAGPGASDAFWAFSYKLAGAEQKQSDGPTPVSDLTVSETGKQALLEWANMSGDATGKDWELDQLIEEALNSPRQLEVGIGNSYYVVPMTHIIPTKEQDAPHNAADQRVSWPTGNGPEVKQFFSSEELGVTSITWSASNGETYTLAADHMDMYEAKNKMEVMEHSTGLVEPVFAEVAEVQDMMEQLRQSVANGKGADEGVMTQLNTVAEPIVQQFQEYYQTMERVQADSVKEMQKATKAAPGMSM